MLLTTLVLYCEGCVKRRKHLQKRLSSPKMSVIKLKSNDEKIFEVDIEVTITNVASIWIYKKCDTSNKCNFSHILKVAKMSVTIKGLLENTTVGEFNVCLFWTHFPPIRRPVKLFLIEIPLCQEGDLVPLPNVRGDILEKVVEWATNHKVCRFN